MSGEKLFVEACQVEDPQRHVASLKDGKLAALISHLQGETAGLGFRGLVLGICELEAAKRWMHDRKDRAGAVGEGWI